MDPTKQQEEILAHFAKNNKVVERLASAEAGFSGSFFEIRHPQQSQTNSLNTQLQVERETKDEGAKLVSDAGLGGSPSLSEQPAVSKILSFEDAVRSPLPVAMPPPEPLATPQVGQPLALKATPSPQQGQQPAVGAADADLEKALAPLLGSFHAQLVALVKAHTGSREKELEQEFDVLKAELKAQKVHSQTHNREWQEVFESLDQRVNEMHAMGTATPQSFQLEQAVKTPAGDMEEHIKHIACGIEAKLVNLGIRKHDVISPSNDLELAQRCGVPMSHFPQFEQVCQKMRNYASVVADFEALIPFILSNQPIPITPDAHRKDSFFGTPSFFSPETISLLKRSKETELKAWEQELQEREKKLAEDIAKFKQQQEEERK